MTSPRDDDRSTAAALAALATFFAGALLVGVRAHVDNSVTVLALAAVVSACGLLGGRRAGVVAAVMAALSFNFFHTQPYLSLRIHDVDDILTTATLLVVGLMAGFSAQVRGTRRQEVEEASYDLRSIQRVLDLVAEGADPEDIEITVRAELLGLLHLSDCRLVGAGAPGVPVLGHAGALDLPVLTYHRDGFELPRQGVAIPIHGTGQLLGHLVCTPVPGAAVSNMRRRTAAVLAGVLGTALGTRPSGTAKT